MQAERAQAERLAEQQEEERRTAEAEAQRKRKRFKLFIHTDLSSQPFGPIILPGTSIVTDVETELVGLIAHRLGQEATPKRHRLSFRWRGEAVEKAAFLYKMGTYAGRPYSVPVWPRVASTRSNCLFYCYSSWFVHCPCALQIWKRTPTCEWISRRPHRRMRQPRARARVRRRARRRVRPTGAAAAAGAQARCPGCRRPGTQRCQRGTRARRRAPSYRAQSVPSRHIHSHTHTLIVTLTLTRKVTQSCILAACCALAP